MVWSFNFTLFLTKILTFVWAKVKPGSTMGSTILPILIGEIPYENQLWGVLQRIFTKQAKVENGSKYHSFYSDSKNWGL